ncbi:hypothetical protein, partial [Pseudomonas viridiflava]
MALSREQMAQRVARELKDGYYAVSYTHLTL